MGLLSSGMAEATASAIVELYERCETGEGNVFTCALCQSMVSPDTCSGCPVYFDKVSNMF